MVSAGTLLTGGQLTEALSADSRVFMPGTWSDGQVRSGGYDLRLAGNMLVAPADGQGSYRSVEADEPEVPEITLRPGDAALVSTAEVFTLDRDVLGQVTPKFRWAARGLLILSGTAIHSGYGRVKHGDAWLPGEGARLHLILANNGPADITLRRHDTIAYLQLFQADPSGVEPEERNLGFEYLRANLFDPSHGPLKSGLAYFRTLKDLESTLGSAVDEQQTKLDAVTQRLDETAAIVDRVQSATNTVVVFGVYLVAVTLLGVVTSALVNKISDLHPDLGGIRAWSIYGLLGVYAGAAILAVWLVAKGIGKQR